jgi:hypothetical protein
MIWALDRASVSKVGGKFRTTAAVDASPRNSLSFVQKDGPMPALALTPEQQEHARILAQEALKAAQAEIQRMAELLASKPDDQVLGATEFQIRDLAHKVAARMIQAEIQHREKKVTRAPVPAALTASTRPSSKTATGQNRS